MCGLFGIAQAKPLDEEEYHCARLALNVLFHRGPDQMGEWKRDGVYLGHRRLSILDTSEAGRQPMVANDVVVTVNGEIYNFKTLREELRKAGHVFLSNSDSEVVLHGYRHWGVKGLAERLDGMYAAVIADHAAGRIFAVRDRAGIKPLYYYFDGRLLVWGSELKAIKTYLGPGGLEVDPTSAVDFLTYRYIPAPKTFYRRVFKLPPASILSFSPTTGEMSVTAYWRLPIDQSHESDAQIEEQLLALLDQSVKDQLISDVPLGLLLSGGIDSSAVAAMASRHAETLLSFSIGFHDPGRDETKYAQLMSRHVGTRHHVHKLANEEMEDLIPKMAAWFDEPFGDTSAIPTFRVCEFTRKSVTVALSGDGGDELFGGYVWYRRYNRLRKIQRMLPSGWSRIIPAFSFMPRQQDIRLLSIQDPLWLYARIRGGIPRDRLERWMIQLGVSRDYDPLWAYRAYFRPDLSPLKAAQVMDFHTYLPDDILTKIDRVSMAVSLECRPPFLSRDLIEFAYSLPESFLYRGGRLKGGLKHTLTNILPDSILSHRKQGFSVPDFGWKTSLVKQHGSFQEAMIAHFIGDKAAEPIPEVIHQ